MTDPQAVRLYSRPVACRESLVAGVTSRMPVPIVAEPAFVMPTDSRPPSHDADAKTVTSPNEVAAAMPPVSLLSDAVLGLVDRHRRAVILLILALYAAGFNAQWRLEPDSALYLAIGRNLVEGQGYTFHGKDHKLAYPGVPWLFGGVFQVFGPDSLVPHLVVMWLMGLATLALTYRLFLLHAGRPTAMLITVGVALSRIFYRYSFELLSDLPFLLGVMAFFVGYEAIFHRRLGDPTSPAKRPRAGWYDGVLLGVGLIVAVASRPAMLALLAAAAMAAGWSLFRGRGRSRWGHLLVAALVVGAVALFYLKDPRGQSQQVDGPSAITSTTYVEEDQLFHLQQATLGRYLAAAKRNLPGVFENALMKASFGTTLLPGLNTVLAMIVVVSGILLIRVRPLWGFWVLATLLMVLLVPKPLDRYFLPLIPILVYAWWTFVRWAERRVPGRRAAGVAFLVLFGVGGIPNVIDLAGFVYEQRARPFLASYKKGRYASAYEAAKMVAAHTPPSGRVLDPRTTWVCVPEKFARVTTFLSRRYCVEPEGDGTRIDPRVQPVYVLEPTELTRPPIDGRQRPSVRQWLADRGAVIAPQAIASVPNKDPDDHRPWTLHRVIPSEQLLAAFWKVGTNPWSVFSPSAAGVTPARLKMKLAPATTVVP